MTKSDVHLDFNVDKFQVRTGSVFLKKREVVVVLLLLYLTPANLHLENCPQYKKDISELE